MNRATFFAAVAIRRKVIYIHGRNAGGVFMEFENLGTLDFREFCRLQQRYAEVRSTDMVPDKIFFAQHPLSISVNMREFATQILHIRREKAWFRERGIPLIGVPRPGSIAVHAPGIIGCYPTIKLAVPVLDAFNKTVDALLSAIQEALAAHGIVSNELPHELRSGTKKEKYSGLWTGTRKIVTWGIAVQQRVTRFGFNIHVCPEREVLDLIHPCGITEYELTSMEREGVAADVVAMEQSVCEAIGGKRFG